jgi:ATP-dependent exoDNAse (exonuclease V) beta subunit
VPVASDSRSKDWVATPTSVDLTTTISFWRVKSMVEPNEKQQRLIRNHEGLYLVDAGPGTGKTFTVTRRYARILDDKPVDPEDVLLVTFTDNAAAEMKDRIVAQSAYGMRELADAPIQTFHSRCYDILTEHGFAAPTHLGIDDRITGSTQILEDESLEAERFQEFVDRFSDAHPEYHAFFRVVDSPSELLGLIKQLAAKGVFPTADGWYRDGARFLDGDFETFKQQFNEANEPRNGGRKQSKLRSKLYGYGDDSCYLPEAPPKSEIRGHGKQVPDSLAERVFAEDRTALQAFVHDLYYGYLEFTLERNYLNFAFIQLYAFVLLCEEPALREDIEYEYAMVDEFQDSSEIQFKLVLLLAGTNNICVVGDWKQSIYSFQYAAVENIQEFPSRLERFAAELNTDAERVGFDTRPITDLELEENYRSTQAIIDFAADGLVAPATGSESVDAESVRERIVELNSNATHENSRLEAIYHEDEHEAVLTKIQEIVDNEAFQIEDDGELRVPRHGDITVLTRTRDFGRELLNVAEQYDLPMAYEGGIELFRTDPAKLLLAWLRILEFDADRGWAPVLEHAGYTLDEIDHLLETESYPEVMQRFATELAALESIGAVAQQVFDHYGYDGEYADVLMSTIQSVHESTTLTRGDLIRYIEQGIESGTTHEISAGSGTDSVTVQTIHATKGLEHPIVILANMNTYRFPPSGGGDAVITYDESTGLRQRQVYSEAHGVPYVYDNWRVDVLKRCLPRNYDEERRLLYVALSRAKSHIVLAAGERPNSFIEALADDIVELEPDIDPGAGAESTQSRLAVSVPTPEGPRTESPHSLMGDDVFEDVSEGRGTEFGEAVHDFAEAYALGEDVVPSNADERHVLAFLDSLDGDKRVEEDVYLPLDADGERVTISGIVDLVHLTSEAAEIVDYKTDRGRHAEAEYRKQLSVYYHVLAEVFPDREVTTSIFYTERGQRVDIEPLSRDELVGIVRNPDESAG